MKSFWLTIAILFSSFTAIAANDPTRPGWQDNAQNGSRHEAPDKGALMPENEPLSGVLYSKQRQVVLLNKRFYRVGDWIGRQKLIRIAPDRIWLQTPATDGSAAREIAIHFPRVATIQKSTKVNAND